MTINNKNLILEFFKDYKPSEENNILIIPKAPEEFEEIFGKKAPYKLVFSLNQHNITQGSELIAQGSYFLSSIKGYMEDKGQTSLIKLNIKIPTTILNNLQLGNCSISKSQKKIDYNFLPEFTFFSNSQALNERKQFLKSYLIKDKEILDLDLTKFKFLKPNSKEIPPLDIQEPYNLAKNNFKEYSQDNVKDMKLKLKEKLETELQRIKEYYANQIKEKDDETETCKKRINTLKSELKHTFYKRDANTLRRNIKESEARCEMLKKRGYKERLEEEENFHLMDEINKHALIIENNLVNITIFYYPLTIFSLTLNNKSKNESGAAKKTVEISYDPLFGRFNFESLVCESCKKNNKIKEINLCKQGKHLVCKGCLEKCNLCKK